MWFLFHNASQKHESTLLHTYVMSEFLTADRSYRTKYFWKKFVAHILTLLFAPFASKLVNYYYWSLNIRKNFENRRHFPPITAICRFSNIRTSKIHCASNNWPIWTQKVPKEALRCGLQTCTWVFQKQFVVHKRSAVKNSFSTYAWSKVDSCFCEAL